MCPNFLPFEGRIFSHRMDGPRSVYPSSISGHSDCFRLLALNVAMRTGARTPLGDPAASFVGAHPQVALQVLWELGRCQTGLSTS